MRKLSSFLLLVVITNSLFGQEKPDNAMIGKIREEGLRKSKVMDIAFQLTDVNGPRLAGSKGYLKAANWAKTELAKWGLTNAALEPWGEFGKAWELKKSYVALAAPYYKPLIAYPKTWTNGTKGLQNAEVILIEAEDSIGLEKYRGRLKNKVLILYRNDTLKQSFTADARRYTNEDLERMSNASLQPRNQNDTAQQRRMRE
ncbi:MAG: peptidase M28, partial [Chitinophagaceae bacterium]